MQGSQLDSFQFYKFCSLSQKKTVKMTKFAFFLTVAMLVGSGSSVHTASANKLRQTAEASNVKPVASNDGSISKKKSMKVPSSQPSAFPSATPSAQPTQKKSGKGMMSTPGKPGY
jgi:hypothetical protein